MIRIAKAAAIAVVVGAIAGCSSSHVPVVAPTTSVPPSQCKSAQEVKVCVDRRQRVISIQISGMAPSSAFTEAVSWSGGNLNIPAKASQEGTYGLGSSSAVITVPTDGQVTIVVAGSSHTNQTFSISQTL